MPKFKSGDEPLPTRILIYGVTGSGKTTLARRLSAATGIPWQEADQLTFLPGWEQVPINEQREIFTRFCAEPKWILDTAYGYWFDIAMNRAELVIALDFPRWVSLSRLLRRTFQRARDRQSVCNGNVETWAKVFSTDSIVLWHFRSFGRKRSRIDQLESAIEGPSVLRFRNPRKLEEWLASLTK